MGYVRIVYLSHRLCSGFESLLEASRCRELAMLYSFFIRFKDGQSLVCKAFGEYIKVSSLVLTTSR